MTDATQIARDLHDSQHRYRQLVGGTGGFLFHVETEDRRAVHTIHYPGVEQVTGYTPDDYRANPLLWLTMIHADDRPVVLNQVEHVLQGENPAPIEHRIRRKDEVLRWVINTSMPVHDANGRMTGYDGLIFDITERKQVEAEREALFRDLKRSNEDWEQFAFIASHDLQEPLRMIVSYVQLLEKRYRGKLDEEADQYIYYAVTGTKRMQELIDDLLRYSQVGWHQMELAPVDAGMIVNEALANLKMAIEEAQGVVLVGAELPSVKGDRIQLRQVFQNLISNALKFHREGVMPEVSITAGFENDSPVFTIKDNGMGIAPQHQARLFQIFQRQNPPNKYPGRGIGLAICKRIVERHGGRIWVESEPGNGAAFRFSLPKGAPA